MFDWLKISLLLCFFGFLKEMRPSEPFVIDYLLPPWRDLTAEDVNRYIWPHGTYWTTFTLIIVLLVTDFLRYKAVIVLCGVTGAITWAMYIWTTSFEAAVVIQSFYGAFVATEVAYFAYIYAKVDKEHYLQVTSHTRAATLCGKCFSGILGQFLIFTGLTDLRGLNVITFVTLLVATCWAIGLPAVQTSLYFNKPRPVGNRVDNVGPTGISMVATVAVSKDDAVKGVEIDENESASSTNRCGAAFQIMWSQLTIAYANGYVLLWSIWYAAGLCGFFQVISYVQMLWISIDNRPESNWNGGVEACTTLLAASAALLASRLHESFFRFRRMLGLLIGISFLQGGALFVTSNTTSRFVSYGTYTFYFVLHSFTITIISAEIAKKLPADSYGLVFGINTFVGLLFQSLLTIVVVSDSFQFELNVGEQFNIYTGFYVALGVMYLIVLCYQVLSRTNVAPISDRVEPSATVDSNVGKAV